MCLYYREDISALKAKMTITGVKAVIMLVDDQTAAPTCKSKMLFYQVCERIDTIAHQAALRAIR